MVALEAWYRQIPANDLHPGDPAIAVESPADVTALTLRVIEENRDSAVPPIVQFNSPAPPHLPIIEAGLGVDVGFLSVTDMNGARFTVGDPTATNTVVYDFAGNVREVPASAQVPVSRIVRGLEHLISTGELPPSLAMRSA
jgi:hypothetical protein